MPPNTNSTLAKEDVLDKNKEMSSMNGSVKKQTYWHGFPTDIKWINMISITLFHVAALYYFLTFPYFRNLNIVMYGIVLITTSGMGVTAGAHRLWTHRTYKAKWPLRVLLASFYYMAGMNSIYDWVRDHRVHHKYTDTESDPHDSTRGFWFSHVGWLMLEKKEEVKMCGQKIDMSDIENDKVVQFFDRNYKLMRIFWSALVPIFIGIYILKHDVYLTIVSQLFMRYTFVLNATWSVNSFAHIFGYHSYDKAIRPTENPYVSIFSGGEGWHNFHHVFPWDYRAGEVSGFFYNPTTFYINMFARLGLAYDLKKATDEHIHKVAIQKGDESYGPYFRDYIKNSHYQKVNTLK